MYFVKRDGRYHDVAGASFADFMAGRLAALPGERATIKDWVDHTSTIFPEVRLKQYLEMRGADAGSWSRLCALPALWAGLLYDPAARAAARDLCRHWTSEDRANARSGVARQALKAQIAGRSVRDIARDMLAIAHQGLKNRGRLSAGLVDETSYLGEIEDIAETGVTAAERMPLELLSRLLGRRRFPSLRRVRLLAVQSSRAGATAGRAGLARWRANAPAARRRRRRRYAGSPDRSPPSRPPPPPRSTQFGLERRRSRR